MTDTQGINPKDLFDISGDKYSIRFVRASSPPITVVKAITPDAAEQLPSGDDRLQYQELLSIEAFLKKFQTELVRRGNYTYIEHDDEIIFYRGIECVKMIRTNSPDLNKLCGKSYSYRNVVKKRVFSTVIAPKILCATRYEITLSFGVTVPRSHNLTGVVDLSYMSRENRMVLIEKEQQFSTECLCSENIYEMIIHVDAYTKPVNYAKHIGHWIGQYGFEHASLYSLTMTNAVREKRSHILRPTMSPLIIPNLKQIRLAIAECDTKISSTSSVAKKTKYQYFKYILSHNEMMLMRAMKNKPIVKYRSTYHEDTIKKIYLDKYHLSYPPETKLDLKFLSSHEPRKYVNNCRTIADRINDLLKQLDPTETTIIFGSETSPASTEEAIKSVFDQNLVDLIQKSIVKHAIIEHNGNDEPDEETIKYTIKYAACVTPNIFDRILFILLYNVIEKPCLINLMYIDLIESSYHELLEQTTNPTVRYNLKIVIVAFNRLRRQILPYDKMKQRAISQYVNQVYPNANCPEIVELITRFSM
jgi:hypothetical protein